MVTWKRWKKIRTRFESLKKADISEEQAWMLANTRKGYWRTAHNPILCQVLSNKRFKTGWIQSLGLILITNLVWFDYFPYMDKQNLR